MDEEEEYDPSEEVLDAFWSDTTSLYKECVLALRDGHECGVYKFGDLGERYNDTLGYHNAAVVMTMLGFTLMRYLLESSELVVDPSDGRKALATVLIDDGISDPDAEDSAEYLQGGVNLSDEELAAFIVANGPVRAAKFTHFVIHTAAMHTGLDIWDTPDEAMQDRWA